MPIVLAVVIVCVAGLVLLVSLVTVVIVMTAVFGNGPGEED